MAERDMLQVRGDKLKISYLKIPAVQIEDIKQALLSCFPSCDMQEYLGKHFPEIGSSEFIETIVGARKPIGYKAKLMRKLAILFPHPFDEIDSLHDFEPYAEMYENAQKDMCVCRGEQAVYLLKRYRYLEEMNDTELCMTRPFFSFNNAQKFIKEAVGGWLWEHEESEIENALTWFEIEKWVDDASSEPKAAYTVSAQGEIWDCSYAEKLCHRFGKSNALGLNLPVPFSVGDVISIDCRPFAPLKHGVVVDIGDNQDCCCVQCLYMKKDGTLGIGALKHSHVFDGFTPSISPLYSAERFEGELPPDESFMLELGKALAEWDKNKMHEKGHSRSDTDFYTKFLDCIISKNMPQQLIEKIKFEIFRNEGNK